MVNLRIRARANGVVVSFVGKKNNGFVEGDVMPAAYIAVPGCGCVPCFVPDASIFSMPACARTWVSVKFCGNNCLVWRIVPLCVPKMLG